MSTTETPRSTSPSSMRSSGASSATSARPCICPRSLVGDRLGLYRAMADGEPVSPADLAERTGTNERYVTEWLAAQAAAGYVDYDADAGTFRLPPEHAALLIDQGAPVFIPGAFQLAASGVKDEPLITEAFRTGEGVALARTPPGPVRRAASASSGPATPPTWSASGCRHWRGSR